MILVIKDQAIKKPMKIFINFYLKIVVWKKSISIFAAAFSEVLFENSGCYFLNSNEEKRSRKNFKKKLD